MKTTIEVKSRGYFKELKSLAINDLFKYDDEYFSKGQTDAVYDVVSCFCFSTGGYFTLNTHELVEPLNSDKYELIFREVDNDCID